MTFIKNIFGRIWALWGLISFIITFLLFFLPSMLSHLFKDEKEGQYFFIRVSKLWMNIWLHLVGCPVTVTGKGNFKKEENYVVIFNHNAFLDVPLSAPFVPGPNKTIAKDSFAKVPVFGWFYKKGSVLVNRKNEKSRVKSYEAMRSVLLSGMHMCIYPEGTRNRTAQPMKPFYDGAFKLAIDAHKKIIPCVISGTKEAMPINKTLYFIPTKLRMHFLPAVSTENTEAKILKEKIYNEMVLYYKTENKV